nr:NERD domain-containing protein [Rhodococcus sp. 14C212]
MLRYVVPKASPYRAWTNFEFMDNHGQWHEIDALVLGRRRLHLVELKHYTGLLQGTETSWVRTTLGGKTRTQRSPLLITRRKAQRLATRIEEEARKVAQQAGLNVEKVRRALPFVQESVFLHGSPFKVEMPDLAKSGLFGPDGFEDETGLPGISTRLLEPPTETKRVDEDLSVIIALALKNLGIARRTERDAGSWTITGTPLASGDDWQEWAATHKGTDERGRARVVSFHRGTPVQARAASHRRMQREFSLLSSLRHDAIVAPATWCRTTTATLSLSTRTSPTTSRWTLRWQPAPSPPSSSCGSSPRSPRPSPTRIATTSRIAASVRAPCSSIPTRSIGAIWLSPTFAPD